jgi:hypothetical protein
MYIAFVLGAAIWGGYDDLHSPRPRYWFVIDFLTTAAWLFFIAAYYYPSLAAPFGRNVVAVFAATLLFTGLAFNKTSRKSIATLT